MKIAVASGKGGTGKTTVSAALAETLGRRAVLFDCDVEEPDAHLFLGGEIEKTESVFVMVPRFDEEKCSGCGACAKSCRFNALASLGKKLLIFPELCHSCGGCLLACPQKALTEDRLEIGKILWRTPGDFPLVTGSLKVGYSLSVPLIRKLKSYEAPGQINILDAPPGTACPMVNTVRDCDHVLLVTEPTPFGLHDLAGAVETLKTLQIPCSVIVNKYEPGCDIPEEYCRKNGIEILMRIPFSPAIARGYARGKTLLQSMPELKNEFERILTKLGAL